MQHPDVRFPHLLPVDASIWRQHLLAHGHDYTLFEYDQRVGEGRDPGDTYDDNIRTMALQLSKRRIDCTGYHSRGVDIFEVTHSAGFTALGQLIAYPILYARTFGTSRSIRPVLITAHIQSDIEPVIKALRIPYFLYPLSESLSEQRSQPN